MFDALIDPEKNRQFWSGYHQESSWKVGADFAIVSGDGNAWDTGEVLAFDPPRRFSVTWNHLHDPAMKAEGESICSFDLEALSDQLTKLTVTHTMPVADSKLIDAVSTGWPMIMSSLKSLLETGRALG
ncbi:MAG: SRPBCC domain-containing protein [Caulobacteraceae bacterium]